MPLGRWRAAAASAALRAGPAVRSCSAGVVAGRRPRSLRRGRSCCRWRSRSLASGLAQRSLDGLDGVEPGDRGGRGHAPERSRRRRFGGRPRRRARRGHRRLEARADGASADALRRRASPARWSRVRGDGATRRARRAVARRPATSAVELHGASPSTGGARATPSAGWPTGCAGRWWRAPRRSTLAQRSLFTGLVLGDDREQPADLADAFRGAGLTHLLAVSGQNVAFVLALAGPLLRRLRLWPRLGAHPRRDRPLRGDDPLRAVGAPGVGDGRAGRDARDGRAAGRPAPRRRPGRHRRWCWSIRCSSRSVGFQLSVCAAVAIVVARAAARRGAPRARRRSGRPLAVTLAAQLGVAPVLLATFGPVPVASLPANLLAVPGGRAGHGVGPDRRARRRRGRGARSPRCCTSRRGSPSAGWSSSPSAPPTAPLGELAASTHGRAGARAGGSPRSLGRVAPGLRRVGWRLARRARCVAAVVAAHAPVAAPLGAARTGVVRWHGDGVGRGGARRRRAAGRPSAAPRSSSRSAARACGTIDLLVVADASVPASVVDARVGRAHPAARSTHRARDDGAAPPIEPRARSAVRRRRRCRDRLVVDARPQRRARDGRSRAPR